MSLKPQMLQEQFALTQNLLPRELGDGLVLRVATVADTEPLAQLTGSVFGRDHFDAMCAAYTRDYMRADHPAISPSNVLVVEDPREHKLVSTTILIPQTWTYAGIPFGVGRPEMVATDPAYRHRGLVRAQFDVLHAWSAALGHFVQGITGIPWYYRQFEYEYALDLGGGRLCYYSNVPMLKDGESEAYHLRPLTLADIPFASALFDRDAQRSLIACPRPEWLWRHLLTGHSFDSIEYRPLQIIETLDGRAIGYLNPSRDAWSDTFPVNELSVVEGQSLRAVMPAVLRWLKTFCEEEALKQTKAIVGIYFGMGREHPVYDAIPELLPRARNPYGWYLRVADVPRFLYHIAPVLEARLARSTMAGYTGELKLDEYRRGLIIVFENGKLSHVENWQPIKHEAHAGFPPLVFLRLLFGEKSLTELCAFYPDCWAKDEAAVLLDALFPKHYSCVMPVG